MKPRILISAGSKYDTYVTAVEGCGGSAVPRYCPDISTEYDGLILCGGGDIAPKYYSQEINGSADIDEKRDIAEFGLVKAFVAEKKPIMGICRGCQLLNVAFGGTLCQDIPNSVQHRSPERIDLVHKVKAVEKSLFFDMYGAEFSVNSFHHQAIKKVGKEMDVILTASDEFATIEAIMHKEYPVFGVQWHPERMCFDKRREDTVDGIAVFRYFISLCMGNC